jgi:Tol biopolymer transport system component
MPSRKLSAVTDGMRVNQTPVWSPDGRFVVFSATGGMYWARARGDGKPQPLIQSKFAQFPTSFNPHGTRLVYSEASPGSDTCVQNDIPGAGLSAIE